MNSTKKELMTSYILYGVYHFKKLFIQKHKTFSIFSIIILCFINTINSQNCWLETEGNQIVSAETKQPVILRAVGLGGWVLQEGYMLNPQGCNGCPGTQWEIKQKLYSDGQDYDQVEAFYQSWRDNFITKADIDYIASLGFNSVRLPMHYELFLTGEQRRVRNNVINNRYAGHDTYKNALRNWYEHDNLFTSNNLEGFRIIDNLIRWCRANDMYIILDLHAAPGGQGQDKNIADIFHNHNLWQFPVFQDVTNRLWQKISQRYSNEPTIAFYDLINEPNSVPGGGQVIHSLLQRLLTTIRNQGDTHMIMIEGNGYGNNYDYLEPFTFSPNKDLIYNAHRYNWGMPLSEDWIPDSNPNQINKMINLINFRNNHQVPVWIGETGENPNWWLRQNIVWLEEQEIGWCHWTYKRHDVGQNAALMRIGGPYLTDGASAMSEVLESIKFENCIPNINTITAVTQDNPAPGTSGCTSDPNPTSAPIGKMIWLKGNNGLYVSSENGDQPMNCNRDIALTWEHFRVIDAGNGRIALQNNGMFISSENGETPINCNRIRVDDWEAFEWIATEDGKVGFKANNGLYMSSQNGTTAMTCDKEVLSGWEAFEWGIVTDTRDPFDNSDNFLIYPNPAKEGKFTIQVKEPSEVRIYDCTGKVIYKNSISTTLNVSDFTSGIYFVRILNKTKKVIKKLIVD
ncbi:cellulase family glycosylhydrolase [Aquimarina sp. RZ0]|uniref:cellulase family glycosylhydrolase n=1 Tax=Aquimarina sp. RZ0 TaxID=2607730 RepID=UPI0011F1722B|nr:cellulase family glycosylhydrolase [Aquimarina sp. RZ0]KAA1245824.1 cellulase family glycosylhydrolase [Aquimarina sp. RZ0]